MHKESLQQGMESALKNTGYAWDLGRRGWGWGLSAHPPATTTTEVTSLKPDLFWGQRQSSYDPGFPIPCLLLAIPDVREGPSLKKKKKNAQETDNKLAGKWLWGCMWSLSSSVIHPTIIYTGPTECQASRHWIKTQKSWEFLSWYSGNQSD